jgi:SWI/SNF-related matrix-associated actin-dependent regulator of chromatin subfamily B member 1
MPLEDDPSPLIPALPDNIAKVITAKHMKELECEAKEREYVDGQHPNYIDGVWHCSNCGCTESIAMGNKSQCGMCGMYLVQIMHKRKKPILDSHCWPNYAG